ncbi:hypothetical protein PF003_g24089 [Phytophthora fragariae]|nr:hypothetical protein PF003_g24089 [Phytophthora fragariae]
MPVPLKVVATISRLSPLGGSRVQREHLVEVLPADRRQGADNGKFDGRWSRELIHGTITRDTSEALGITKRSRPSNENCATDRSWC